MKAYLNAAEVAKLLHVDRATVSRWIKKGLLTGAIRPAGKQQWRIPLSSYERLRTGAAAAEASVRGAADTALYTPTGPDDVETPAGGTATRPGGLAQVQLEQGDQPEPIRSEPIRHV